MKLQKNIVNRFNREKKYRLSVFSMSPHFDWKILLGAALVILFLITGLGFQIYTTILETSEYEIRNINRLDKYIDDKELNKTLERFKEKEKEFNLIFVEEGQSTENLLEKEINSETLDEE